MNDIQDDELFIDFAQRKGLNPKTANAILRGLDTEWTPKGFVLQGGGPLTIGYILNTPIGKLKNIKNFGAGALRDLQESFFREDVPIQKPANLQTLRSYVEAKSGRINP